MYFSPRINIKAMNKFIIYEMKKIIPHFVSKERLERLASEFFGTNGNANGSYEVIGEDVPYPEGGFGESIHVSKLVVRGILIVESEYIERHLRGEQGSLGRREVKLRETKFASDYRQFKELFDYLQSRIPQRFSR